MNILGVGAAELVAVLLIMLVFAGPKRMIHWSYVLGQHVAKFRKIWSETVDLVQKEFDDAGVDIKLPKEPPTRKSSESHRVRCRQTHDSACSRLAGRSQERPRHCQGSKRHSLNTYKQPKTSAATYQENSGRFWQPMPVKHSKTG